MSLRTGTSLLIRAGKRHRESSTILRLTCAQTWRAVRRLYGSFAARQYLIAEYARAAALASAAEPADHQMYCPNCGYAEVLNND